MQSGNFLERYQVMESKEGSMSYQNQGRPNSYHDSQVPTWGTSGMDTTAAVTAGPGRFNVSASTPTVTSVFTPVSTSLILHAKPYLARVDHMFLLRVSQAPVPVSQT
jgi:hypothetical protein